MSDAGGVLYDRDAVYVEIPDWKVRGGCVVGVPRCD